MRPRRLLAACLLLALLVPPVSAGSLHGSFGEDRSVLAWWITRVKGTNRHLGVLVVADDRTEAVTGHRDLPIAIVAHGRCRRSASGYFHCHSTRQGIYVLRRGEVTVDPLLREARLSIRRGPFRHDVRWTAEGHPGPSITYGTSGISPEWFDEEFMVHGASLARVHATVFGRKVGGRLRLAYFGTGGYARVVWDDESDGTMVVRTPGGTWSVPTRA